jgi:GNAT superfamily N-acetyltransferase
MVRREPVRIQEVTEGDVPLILAFIRELAQYEKLLDSVSVTEESLRSALFGPQPFAEAIIAFKEQEPVAFALYFFNYSTFAGLPGLYLEDIFVRPAYRNTGIGRQLFAFLAKTALERGCNRMELSVLNWNEPAIRFYKKLAAKPITDWTVFHLSRESLEKLAG